MRRHLPVHPSAARWRRPAVLLLLVALAMGAPAPGSAQEQGSATEGALFLLLPVGAKGVGLARAMSALQGPESVWWNPAGLGTADASRILVTRGEDLSGTATSVSGLFARPGLGVLGLSYSLLDVGEVELRDIQGNFLGTVLFRYHTGVLSTAAQILEGVSLGVNFKVIQSRLVCRGQCLDAGVTATTYALDLGGQWEDVAGLPLTVGAMVAHLGPRLQVRNADQADPLPTRLRVALAYDVLSTFVDREDVRGRVVIEVEERLRNPGRAVYVATELSAGVDPGVRLWAGNAFGGELQTPGVGVGIGARFDRFELGISRSLTRSTLSGDTEPVHVTFGFIL